MSEMNGWKKLLFSSFVCSFFCVVVPSSKCACPD